MKESGSRSPSKGSISIILFVYHTNEKVGCYIFPKSNFSCVYENKTHYHSCGKPGVEPLRYHLFTSPYNRRWRSFGCADVNQVSSGNEP